MRWHLGGRATQFDEALRHDLVAERDARFVDLRADPYMTHIAADGFHPGPGIYAA